MAKIEEYKKVVFDNGKTLFVNYAEPIDHSDKILRVSKDGKKWAVMNAKTGEFVSDYKYIFSSIKMPLIDDYRKYYFEEKGSNEKLFFVTELNGKCGALNEEGIESIPCEYDYCEYINKNIVMVGIVKDSVMFYGGVNYKNEEIIPIKYREYSFRQESTTAGELSISCYKGKRRLFGITNEWPELLILLRDEDDNVGAYDTCGRIRIPFCKERIIDFWGQDLI